MQSMFCIMLNIVCLSLCTKNDWIENIDLWYYISPAEQIVDYQKASAMCESMNSRLVVITNQDQNDFIENTISDEIPRWIGLSNNKTSGHNASYKCHDKEYVWNYDLFCDNNYNHFENGQTPIQSSSCMGVTYKSGRWIANNLCEINSGFICQLEYKNVHLQFKSIVKNTDTPEKGTTSRDELPQTSTLTTEQTSTLEALTTKQISTRETITSEETSTLETTASFIEEDNKILQIVAIVVPISVIICIVLVIVPCYCIRHRRRRESQHDKILQEIHTYHKDAKRGKHNLSAGHINGESHNFRLHHQNDSRTRNENQTRGQDLQVQSDERVYYGNVHLNENQSAGQYVNYQNDPAAQNVYQNDNISGYENTLGGQSSRKNSDQGMYSQIKDESNPIVDKTRNGQRGNYYYNVDACRVKNKPCVGNDTQYEYVCHQNGKICGGTNPANGVTARGQKDQSAYLHLDIPASQAQSYEALQPQNK